MSISSRLEAINQHLLDDYSVLTLGGADLTNVDKNIQNLKTQWEDRLKYYLANGLDVVWNNWNKITGSGETITLNNTIEAKMDVVYKGNTSQFSTTGKNIAQPNENIVTSKNGITCSYNSTDQTFTFNGTCGADNTTFQLTQTIMSFTGGITTSSIHKISGTIEGYCKMRHYDSDFILNCIYDVDNSNISYGTTVDTFTSANNASTIRFNNGSKATNFKIKLMVAQSTNTEYEPYTGGISAPNPSYPYPVNVVTGNNSIKVEGKNLFDKNGNLTSGYKEQDGETASSSNFKYTEYIRIQPNTIYTTSGMANGTGGEPSRCYYDKNKIFISSYRHASHDNIIDTSPANAYYMIESVRIIDLDTIQITVGGTIPTTYEPYQSQSYAVNLETMELCKIGDYQDYIRKSTGKNLFNKDSANIIQNKYLNSSGVETSDNSFSISDYMEVKPNTTYSSQPYENKSACICFYDSNKTYLSSVALLNVNPNFTTPNNCKYIRTSIWKADINLLQINEGSTALPYEPYGKVWYLHKDIGKVVFNGSESDWRMAGNQFGKRFSIVLDNSVMSDTTNGVKSLCSYFTLTINGGTWTRKNVYVITTSKEFLCTLDETYTTLEQFKTWLSTHNTDVYYVLATPTTTEITDSTLISQLEAIKKSYNEQTNISQTNADKPFILDVTALGN